jgi:hypothetical protein
MLDRGTFSLSMPNSASCSAVIGDTVLVEDVGDQQHVRPVTVEVEPLVHALAQHGGRKRPETIGNIRAQPLVALPLTTARIKPCLRPIIAK